MPEETWGSGQSMVQRPIGDLLEEILSRGAAAFPRYLALYPAAPPTNRISIVLGGLALGLAVVEAVREHLSRRDSPEKWALAAGLGEIGHPEVEGFFARVLREKNNEQAMLAAVGILGKIRGSRSLPLVVEALGNPFLFEAACRALASYGGSQAVAALLPKAAELPAFRALAELGAEEARELFAKGLQEGPPRSLEAARGIARLGEAALGRALLPLLGSEDEAEARAAFEAYSLLGAPEGPEPLLRALEESCPAWMIAALGQVQHPEVHRRLVAALAAPARRGVWDKVLFWRRRKAPVDEREVYRALRRAEEPEVVQALAQRLTLETEATVLRELLSNRALLRDEACLGPALEAWSRDDLLARYFAARALLEAPTEAFLSQALEYLGKPGFCPLDAASPLADASHVLAVYSQDNNPCLLLGGFLDSGLVDLDRLSRTLEARFAVWGFPKDAPPRQALTPPEDRGISDFLEALAEARPASRDALARLWNLLTELEDRGDPLLDLFLCSTGAHRGGVQRALVEGMAASLGRFLQGKDDRHIPELDALARRIPPDGPLRAPLRELLERSRRTLMAECRDMALFAEGSAKGDMVLIEELRAG